MLGGKNERTMQMLVLIVERYFMNYAQFSRPHKYANLQSARVKIIWQRENKNPQPREVYEGPMRDRSRGDSVGHYPWPGHCPGYI